LIILDLLGYYIYAEASNPAKEGDVAKLQSKEFPATSGRCIRFSYSMYGTSGMGSLNVFVIDALTRTKLSKIFSKSGDQGKGWHNTNATIIAAKNYKVDKHFLRLILLSGTFLTLDRLRTTA